MYIYHSNRHQKAFPASLIPVPWLDLCSNCLDTCLCFYYQRKKPKTFDFIYFPWPSTLRGAGSCVHELWLCVEIVCRNGGCVVECQKAMAAKLWAFRAWDSMLIKVFILGNRAFNGCSWVNEVSFKFKNKCN